MVIKNHELHGFRNNIKKEALLVFITVYTSFLHERSLMLMISVIACCVLARILLSKKLVRWWLWCVFFIGYFGSKLLLNIYKSHIWKGIPVNSSATASAINGLSELSFNATNIKGMLMIIFGILFTQVSLTCGVILISVIAILYKSASFISKEKRNTNYRECVLAILGISYMIGWLMLVGGQGITWLSGVVEGLNRVGPVWVYPFKAFTYTRYSGNFVPVIVFLGIILFESEPAYQKRIVRASAITGFFIALFWYIFILPYRVLSSNDYYFFPYSVIESELPGINVHIANIIHVIFLLCLLLLFQYCLKTKMIIYLTVAVVLLTNFQRYAIFEYSVKDNQLGHYEWANAGTEFLSTIKNELKAMDSGPVYVLDSNYRKRTPGAYCSYFQYLNYDVDLVHGMPHDDYSDAIIFTNLSPTTKLLKGFMRAKLDDREFVLCRGSKYIDLLTRYGVKLLPYESK